MTRIEGIHFQTGKPVSLTIENGRIKEIEANAGRMGGNLPWIGPGLVDLQINGYNGMDFNTLPFEEELVHRVSQSLWKAGVTSYFPTIITNSDEAVCDAVRTIARACSQDGRTAASIAGIHLEGPFISPEDGPRGAHSRKYVKPPDWALFQQWQEAAQGKIKIVTLSPEWPGAADFIAKCTESGITVAIGHTAATPEQIRDAVEAGARMSTHLGNGAHLMLPRHPNYLWEQLADDRLWACVIADGFHLPESVLKVVLRVKGKQAILVSDAVYLSGMKPGEYKTHIGGKVVLTPAGKLHLTGNPGLLAGSAQMLPWGIAHLVKKKLCRLPEAWEMASIRPSELVDLPGKHGLSTNAPADLVLFEWNGDQIAILQTIKNGQTVYGADEMKGGEQSWELLS
ncbi:N-acetylglucosamine-6-phosphate deacetylase [Lihuaxuella thermophila]|uniref:N-acetylglucosamine-6-phosphate deacetylase n=1 Tax=Lihuaxuella thermophila TaxID=1173111 RepID=A0A1H8E3I8_9BACL|nr:amidohydrolase family protein [Lihuaxuella thermophila]SEN13348.1 N-acetylglucosamine-6-phosphate deacetylase [Lihuaxuella thermophila]